MDSFEWVLSFEDVEKYLQPEVLSHSYDAPVLTLGCGNSRLSEKLYTSGFKNLSNLDNRVEVIEQMKQEYEDKMPSMKWILGDALACPEVETGGYKVVIDKGLFDYLLAQKYHVLVAYLTEVQRVVDKQNGVFVLISFHDVDYLKDLLPLTALCFSRVDTFTIPGTDVSAMKSLGSLLLFRNNGEIKTNIMSCEAFARRIEEEINDHFKAKKPILREQSCEFKQRQEAFLQRANREGKQGRDPKLPCAIVYKLIIPAELQVEYSYEDFCHDAAKTRSEWKHSEDDLSHEVESMTFSEAWKFLQVNQ
mmetsp:Transcript_10254/g.11784  ORF Transcript_10254/g.11784 Transcript_10254/m.11784 type:complete len:306 (-) Transcript_10254:1852-2769(-)